MSMPSLFLSSSSREAARPPVRSRVSTWHMDCIIDHLLANPGATYGEIASVIKRGQVWVSMVMRSDAFQQHYRERRLVVNEAVKDAVSDKLAEVAVAAADLSLRHMRDNPQGISFPQKVDTLVQAAKTLGFGIAPPPATTINVGAQNTVMLASPDQIARARERLRSRQDATPPLQGIPEKEANEYEQSSESSPGLVEAAPSARKDSFASARLSAEDLEAAFTVGGG